MTRPISFLIKPASSLCNLCCKYCFYHSLSKNRDKESYGIMSYDTLENLVKKALLFDTNHVTFAFQGGEPTLAGLDFYKELIKLEKKYNVNNIRTNHTIQTNGFTINEEWAGFLKENDFLVGVSLDGYKEIHDLNRIDIRNNGSFKRVMASIGLFNKYKIEYNILFVVTRSSARHVNKIYNFFRKNNFQYLQFIPCLDPLGEKHGQHQFSLTPKAFSKFLIDLFDNWYRDTLNGHVVSIRYFNNLLSMIMGYPPESCSMNGVCSCQMVVEANGSVYPCDFYVLDELSLGNINVNTIPEIHSSTIIDKFIEPSKAINSKCRNCQWLKICRGGCRREKEPFINENPSLNYFCEAYDNFFKHSIEKLVHIAKTLK